MGAGRVNRTKGSGKELETDTKSQCGRRSLLLRTLATVRRVPKHVHAHVKRRLVTTETGVDSVFFRGPWPPEWEVRVAVTWTGKGV